jgi:hypothetical protein
MVETVTAPAVAVNVVDVAPCGTVTAEGMLTLDGEAFRPMLAPPLKAAEVRVTVQVDVLEAVMESGLHERLLKCGV